MVSKAITWTILVLLLVYLNVLSSSVSSHRPIRPIRFQNPEEVRQYLQELKEYYALMGRPR